MNKQQEITKQTRQNLVEAFWQLYRMKRLEKITIKEITDKAGYNRGTFYEYFTDIYAILEHVEQELLDKLQHVMMLPPYGLDGEDLSRPKAALATTFKPLIDLFHTHGDYFTVLLGDYGDPSFLTKIKNNFKPFLRDQFSGNFDENAEFELDYTLEYTLSAMIGILSHWFSQAEKPPLETLFRLIQELTNNGVNRKVLGIRD
ncbi:TetR/AcrR family transcriptional regulator [Paenibacillus illinoisensis]|uniref:TetR/AcrR family transcriptional regulator n=1 Tax=Paenibacillus illinoisensis TaxID=59845 RepID=UPI003D99E297